MNDRQKGFTTVELVIVLLIAGVLLVIIYAPSVDVFDSEKTSETKRIATAFEKSIHDIRLKWSAEGSKSKTVEVNGQPLEVTTNGWVEQLNADVAGCKRVWENVLPGAPAIDIYDRAIHSSGWSVGAGPNVCFYINQKGEPFDEENTPYFRYSYEIGQVTRVNM